MVILSGVSHACLYECLYGAPILAFPLPSSLSGFCRLRRHEGRALPPRGGLILGWVIRLGRVRHSAFVDWCIRGLVHSWTGGLWTGGLWTGGLWTGGLVHSWIGGLVDWNIRGLLDWCIRGLVHPSPIAT